MSYLGDFALGSTIDTKFTTVDTTGAPITLSGVPVISAYPDNSTTEITAGITLTVDFDTRTGANHIRIIASSGNGYASGSNYQLMITTGTVSGISVVGYIVAEFSIEARSSLRPTTAGRTLDVSATGEAGIDWANVGTPTTAVNLTNTTISNVNVLDGRIPSSLGPNGFMRSDVRDFGGNSGTFSIGRPEVNTTHFGGTQATFAAHAGIPDVHSAYIGGSLQVVPGTTGGLVTVIRAGTAQAASTSVIRLQVGYTGDPTGMSLVVISDAGIENRIVSAFDPGTLDATVDPAFANTPTGTVTYRIFPFGAVPLDDPPTGTDVSAIRTKTDQLSFTVANQLDTNIRSVNGVTVSGSGTGGDPWGP